MRKIILLLMCLIILTSLSGCADKITEGEVYEKEYREEQTVTVMYPLVISNGKTNKTMIVPYYVHYPDRYVIHIKAFVDEEWVTEDYYVSEEVYDSINIGDMFIYDESRGDLTDEPYTKERSVGEG